MYPLADLVVLHQPAPGESDADALSARRYELIHSEMVIAPGRSTPGGSPEEFGCECLVSVLREEWGAVPQRARIRVMHTAPALGPLESVITGMPVPWIVRLRGGEISPFREIAAVPISLEVRHAGRPEGARALRAFELAPASSYTIVIAGCGEHAAEVI